MTLTNIRSLLPKRENISSILDDSNTDIAVLTETWLHPNILDAELFSGVNIFSIYRCDRSERKGGGVLIAIKNTLSSFLIDTHSPLEIVWAACFSASSKILIGACYRPPDAGPSFSDELRKSIAAAVQSYQCENVYLLGDFNFPDVDWPSLSSPSRASVEFINLTLDFNFFQTVDAPTRGSNLLDLILSNAPETIGPITYRDGLSDHKLLHFPIEVPFSHTGKDRKIIRDYNKADYAAINSDLEVFLVEGMMPLFDTRTVNENWCIFRDKVCGLVDKFVPIVTITNDRSNPWFTKSLRRLRNKKSGCTKTPKMGKLKLHGKSTTSVRRATALQLRMRKTNIFPMISCLF